MHNIVHTAVAHARRINQQYDLSSIFRISLGTVHNIVHSAVAHARRINQQYDLSSILIGLLDEIFQAGDPVLVGVDATSTFCFLLSLEQHRDANTWGVRLLELVDQGFAPKATIADFGSGLRAGHQQALPEVPCRGDVFHALYHTGPLVRYLENRAYEAMDARAKLERKQAATERRPGRKDQSLAKKLSYARPAEAKALALADEVALLGERQVKAYPRTQIGPRTVGKANRCRVIGAFRKTLSGITFLSVQTDSPCQDGEARRGPRRR